MKSLVVVLIFCSYFLISAQVDIPYNHTYQGNPIYGKYHSYLEREYGVVRVPLEMEFSALEKGTYKLKNSSIIRNAYIDFKSKKIIVKESDSKPIKKKRIKISDVEYLKLGIDSFFVINNIKDHETFSKKERLAKHIASFDSISYAQCFNFELNGSLSNKFFISKKVGDSCWNNVILKGESLQENTLMPYVELNKKTNITNISEDEFLQTIKELQYCDKLKSGGKFYFSRNWEEVKNKENAYYFSKVTNKEQSIYTVEYSTINGQKIYDANYSSFNPNVKNGEFNVYDKGILSEKRVYFKDELESITHYSINGHVDFVYKYVKPKGKKISKVIFEVITTSDNKKLTSPINGTYVLKGIDNNIKHIFNNDELVTSYYENDAGKVYHFNSVTSIDISLFQIDLSNYLATNELFNRKKYSENLEGTILLDVTTNRKGKVVSYKILNKLDNSLDKIFKNFCFVKLSKNASFKTKFKNIKLDDKKANCRFLLPIVFRHNRFHETFIRPSYNNYNDFFFRQWQQQFFQQQIPLSPQINLPNLNRF